MLFVETAREAMSGWDTAEAKVRQEADDERRLLENGSRDMEGRINRVKVQIVNHPKFRAAGKRQRPLLAETIGGPRPEDHADMFARVRGVENAVEKSKDECSRWEREISSRLTKVVGEFAGSCSWNPNDSMAAKRRAAAEFLMDYADGWRLPTH